MLNRLAYRNVKRATNDYIVYIMTLSIITALIYSFGSLFFDKELSGEFEIAGMMKAMIGVVTFFIVMIVAWLINYMAGFILEKRSKELGIYLLIGMKWKTVANLYMRETVLLGIVSFIPGLMAGLVLQQIIMAVLSSMVNLTYRYHLDLNLYTLLVTLICYGFCYLLALFRCRRKFRKMNIYGLMTASCQNEEIKESNENTRKWIFPFSVLLIIAFWTIFPSLTNTIEVFLFLILLVIDIYMFYMGISAWIICYVRKKKNGIYNGQNLFFLRQFSSKIRTMQFTMGTLTALFTIALMGCSLAMMFSDFQNKVLDVKWPFDVSVYSSDPEDDFRDEQNILLKNVQENDSYIYRIYTNKQDQANTWMYTHLRSFGTIYINDNGSPHVKKIRKALESEGTYCRYDTYMKLSDYNYLRGMLGYKQIILREDEYAIQIKSRLRSEVKFMPKDLQIRNMSQNSVLQCQGIYSEPFSQDGHNGGDYLLIVPDAFTETMQAYYSELAVDITGNAPAGLQKKLDRLSEDDRNSMGHAEPSLNGNSCSGSDQVIVYAATNLVRDNLIQEVKYMLASLIVPGLYIGLVFLCIALTVLSVNQLSDASKYRRHYRILDKIGLNQSLINRLILKQLVVYYLCPAAFAILISGSVVLRISRIFIISTGVHTVSVQYFGVSVLIFLGIYFVYFIGTYIGFKRNVYRSKQ